MIEEPTPRQVLYGLVAGAFHGVVGVLAVGSARLAPVWWTATVGVGWVAIAVILVWRWRRTGLVLGLSLGGFFVWTAGAALLLA
ncbi:hypothetical protein BH23ACT5_BH23ACT5_05800 [soil metagenome]